jgi:hypothetical protein
MSRGARFQPFVLRFPTEEEDNHAKDPRAFYHEQIETFEAGERKLDSNFSILTIVQIEGALWQETRKLAQWSSSSRRLVRKYVRNVGHFQDRKGERREDVAHLHQRCGCEVTQICSSSNQAEKHILRRLDNLHLHRQAVSRGWNLKEEGATGVHIRCFLSSDDLFPVFLTPQQVILAF